VINYGYDKPHHSKALVPGNLLLGSENCVYIVDFGIARRYKNPRNGARMAFLNGKPFVGTVHYVSFDTHLGIAGPPEPVYSSFFFKAQTRRDGIECLAYSFLDFFRDLPWGRITGFRPKQLEERVREKKRSWTPERL